MESGECLRLIKPQPLGTGGQATVYLAEDTSGKSYAVKQMSLSAEHRLRREVEILRILEAEQVEGVLRIHSTGANNQNCWFAMDHIAGSSLGSYCETHRPLSRDAVLDIARQLSAVLKQVHDCGIVHRDISPANILVSDNRVYLIDFGYSRSDIQNRITLTREGLANLIYSAPELLSGAISDRAVSVYKLCDVYSFGAVLFLLTTGTPPEEKFYTGAAQPKEHLWPWASGGEGVDTDLQQLIANCLRICPAERPQGFSEITHALDLICTGTDARKILNPIPSSEDQSRRRQSWQNSARYLLRKYFGAPSGPVLLWIEWIILAAADNGLFEYRKKKGDDSRELNALHKHLDISPEDVCVALTDDLGVFGKTRCGSTKMLFLKDIDRTVIPRIREYIRGLHGGSLPEAEKLESEVRFALKSVAKFKAKEEQWSLDLSTGVVESQAIAVTTTLDRNSKTIEVLKSVEESAKPTLLVISEYATWMRRTPFDVHVKNIAKRVAQLANQGRMAVILAAPPPFGSEGFIEWAESVYFLLEQRAEIHVMSRGHDDHLTLGDGVAVDFMRDRSNVHINYNIQRKREGLEKLLERFEDYLKSEDTVSLSEWRERNPLILSGDDFELLAVGCFQLTMGWRADCEAKSNAAVERLIDEVWQRELGRRGDKETPEFHDGTKIRFDRFRWVEETLVIETGPTTYKKFWGTNRSIPLLLGVVAENELSSYLSNALAVNVTLVTRDGKFVVGRRQTELAEHGGMFHVIGGHLEEGHITEDSHVDVFSAVADEVHEELKYVEESSAKENVDITNIVCHGLVRPIDTLKPELVFSATVDCLFSELGTRAEHTSLFGIEVDEESTRQFLLSNRDRIVPSGKASIVCFGLVRFGSEWMIDLLDELNQEELRTGRKRQDSHGMDLAT